MFNKKTLINFIIIINIIILFCPSMNVFAADAYSIFTMPAVAVDANSNLWVYAGTGNKIDPTNNSANAWFYAVKDSDRTSTHTSNALSNVTADDQTYTDSSSGCGWKWNFSGQGEKVVAEPVVSDQKVYLTSYIPATGSSGDTCSNAGTAKLYIVNYITAAGYCGGDRSEVIGTGVPSAPVLSVNPDTHLKDVFVSTSEEAGPDLPHTAKVTDPSPVFTSNRNLIYWHDMRVK